MYIYIIYIYKYIYEQRKFYSIGFTKYPSFSVFKCKRTAKLLMFRSYLRKKRVLL